MSWTTNFQSVRSLFIKTTAFSLAIFGLWFVIGVNTAKAQAFSEGFDVVPVVGWTTQNNSVPIGTVPGWFQGNTAVFPAQTGPITSYIGANFNNTTGANTISNWLLTPNRTLSSGDVIKFWTRTTTANPFPDRMQVRISLAGASTNVGTGSAETAVGDFTTKILDINPGYELGVYPEVWTEFTLTLTSVQVPTPTSGRIAFRYFVEMGGPAGDNSNFIGIDNFSYTPAGPPMVAGDAPVDFNGDGRTDYAVSRNVGGGAAGQVNWYYNLNNSATPTAVLAWGLASDVLVPEDYDGDDKDDLAVWRPGAAGVASFYILQSLTNTVRVEAFGQTGDDPTVVDDYNNDNKTDLAVYRAGAQSIWYYRTAVNGPVTFTPWGTTGDFPVPGDYDGNGSADFVVQRPVGGQGVFWTRLSTGATLPTVTFGTATDVVVPGDYDGDGKTDIATSRAVGGAIQWQYIASMGGAINYITFGASATDVVAQGDYNGDGRTDAAIWRPSATANQSAFWVRSTVGGAVNTFAIGANGDVVPANYNTH